MPELFDLDPNVSGATGPFFPIVQLKLGTEDFIVTIPPDHLMEFTVVSKKGADEATFIFIDHTFGKIEQQIFKLDRESKPLLYRWGFPGHGLEKTMWNKLLIRNYIPTISASGVRIHLGGRAIGSEFAMLVEPTTYFGKISNVVKTIAAEMGFAEKDTFVEETDDDENEVKQTEWFTGNLTRIDMINKLAEIAKSKSNPNDTIYFKLGKDGKFHFHTETYSKNNKNKFGKTQDPKYRQFRVLYGQSNEVIQFTPRYQTAQGFGAFANKTIAGTLDPRSKQFQQRVLSRKALGLTSKKADPAKGGKTTSGDLTKSKDAITQRKKANSFSYSPSKQVAIGGRCAGKTKAPYGSSERALTKIENAYKEMQKYIAGGTLELVGTPDHADFSQDEHLVDIVVVLPSSAAEYALQPDKYTGIHWSSGRYRIDKITHTITSSYHITVDLHRTWQGVGTEPAKTGPPSKPEKPKVKTT